MKFLAEKKAHGCSRKEGIIEKKDEDEKLGTKATENDKRDNFSPFAHRQSEKNHRQYIDIYVCIYIFSHKSAWRLKSNI